MCSGMFAQSVQEDRGKAWQDWPCDHRSNTGRFAASPDRGFWVAVPPVAHPSLERVAPAQSWRHQSKVEDESSGDLRE